MAADCWRLIRADLHRCGASPDAAGLARALVTTPAMRFVVTYRVGRWARRSGGHRLVRLLTSLAYRRLSVKLNLEIPFTTEIGPGLKLLHVAGGVVINPKTVIGSNCTIGSGVVVGGIPGETHPCIGDDVTLSTGCVVLGNVAIADGSQVGANAVVTRDVPPGVVVVGVPARVLEGASPMVPTRSDW